MEVKIETKIIYFYYIKYKDSKNIPLTFLTNYCKNIYQSYLTKSKQTF